MPRRSPTAARNVPYDQAIALVGHRARLIVDVPKSTAANWRARGVPWNVVGPILAEVLDADQGRIIVPRSDDALAGHRLLEALALMTRARGARWQAAVEVLRALRRRR